MKISPRTPGSILPIACALLAVLVLVGAGMYFLGRRSKNTVPVTTAAGAGQTAPASTDSMASAPTRTGERHLAPHDTFYLLQYVSVKTPTGIIGFEPGQEVHLVEVKRAERKLVVGDGQAQVEVGPEQLTNDMDIAALVRQKDQANQAKVAQYVASEQKAYDDAQRTAAETTEKAADKINQQQQQAAQREADKVAANNASQKATDANAGNASGASSVGGDSKLDEPAVPVGGTSGGYGYAGSAYYGSPYSYFGGASTATSAPATAPAATGGAGAAAANPASVGAGRR